MPRENAAERAKRYLGEGRLYVRLVGPDGISAFCRGDGEWYRLGYRDGQWFCSCPAVSRDCAHLRGLRLITTRPGGRHEPPRISWSPAGSSAQAGPARAGP